jgi:parvulin-like peptidyl-prolyl isomerase
MNKRWSPKTVRGVKIAAVVLLILLGLLPLPLLALPYDILDWTIYDPVYQEGSSYPPPPPAPAPEIPCADLPAPGEPLVARINTQGIRLQAYERELGQFLDAKIALGADAESSEFQADLPLFRQQVLDLMIQDVLIQQAAVRYGIQVADQEIQEQAAEQVSAGGGMDLFREWLKATNQSWDEFRRQVCQDLLQERVQDFVTTGISETMDMVLARQILVPTEDAAVTALTRLASGEAFPLLAEEVSVDPLTRDRGGDLGWLPRDMGWTAPAVAEAAFSGSAGQVQGPVPAGEDYAIVQTLEQNDERTLDPEAQNALRATVFERWLANERDAAEIEIYIDLEAEVP